MNPGRDCIGAVWRRCLPLGRRVPRGAGLAALLTAGLIAGCAGPTIRPPQHPPPEVELTSVPFFPQSRYQCGPAALATVLGWSGRSVTPKALKPRVYVPDRHGSLQPEIQATARAEGRLAYPLAGGLPALTRELQAGHPVLVLQNLGLSWLPEWHYAVVVGTAAGPDRVILRSGRQRRHVTPLDTFLRTWRRGKDWGLVVLPPGQLPATARPTPYLKAASDLEGSAGAQTAIPAYRAGLEQWPDDARFVLALANAQDAGGDDRAALHTLQAAVGGRHAGAAMLYNNLAVVAAHLGRWDLATRAIDRAIELGGAYAAEFRRTRREILCSRPGTDRSSCPAD